MLACFKTNVLFLKKKQKHVSFVLKQQNKTRFYFKKTFSAVICLFLSSCYKF